MSKRVKSQIDIQQEIIGPFMALIHVLRSTHKIKYNEIGRLLSESDSSDLEVERKLVYEITSKVRKQNPQVSARIIFDLLIESVAGIVVFNPDNPISDDKIADMAREKIIQLLGYSAQREIDIPIVNLKVDGPPTRFGKVIFHPISNADQRSDWWEKIRLSYLGKPESEVLSYGRVVSTGDWEIALNYAEKALRKT
jgi:hypothetical protein